MEAVVLEVAHLVDSVVVADLAEALEVEASEVAASEVEEIHLAEAVLVVAGDKLYIWILTQG